MDPMIITIMGRTITGHDATGLILHFLTEVDYFYGRRIGKYVLIS